MAAQLHHPIQKSFAGVAIQGDDAAYETMRAACCKVMDRIRNIHVS
jgi:hypothetical protein